MILRWLKEHWNKWWDVRLKVRAAEYAFECSYLERKLIRGMSAVFHDTGESLIVQLCHDWGGIPPRRTWWLVSNDGSCRELSFEETNAMQPVPEWR